MIKEQNNPQQCKYGLYAEQFSGTSFTQPRHKNHKSWLYRIQPTVGHTMHTELNDYKNFISNFHLNTDITSNPDQLRWKPFSFPAPDSKINFLQGMFTLAGAGSPILKVIYFIKLGWNIYLHVFL